MLDIAGGTRGFCRMVALAGLVFLLLAPTVAPVGAQVSQDALVPLDLAALLIHPADLEAAGIGGGWGQDIGQAYTLVDDAVKADPVSYGFGAITLSALPNSAQMLRDSGWMRLQDSQIGTHNATEYNSIDTAVDSAIQEFNTAEGATTFFNTLGTTQALDTMILGSVTQVDTTVSLGDESGMWKNQSATLDDHMPLTDLTMWVRVDRFILGVSVVDFTNQNPPQRATLTTIMTLLVNRFNLARLMPSLGVGTCGDRLRHDPGAALRDQLAGRLASLEGVPMPGVSPCILRLDGGQMRPIRDDYAALDGQVIPDFQQAADDVAQNQEYNTANGITNDYHSTQEIQGIGADGAPVTVSFYLWVTTFTDDRSAQTWLDGYRSDRADVIQPMSTTIGEDSLLITVDNDGWLTTEIDVRVGNVLIMVASESQQAQSSADTMMILAQEQATCMRKVACLDPVAIPPGLFGQ